MHKRLKRFLNSLLSRWSNFALSQGQRRTAFKHGQLLHRSTCSPCTSELDPRLRRAISNIPVKFVVVVIVFSYFSLTQLRMNYGWASRIKNVTAWHVLAVCSCVGVLLAFHFWPETKETREIKQKPRTLSRAHASRT